MNLIFRTRRGNARDGILKGWAGSMLCSQNGDPVSEPDPRFFEVAPAETGHGKTRPSRETVGSSRGFREVP